MPHANLLLSASRVDVGQRRALALVLISFRLIDDRAVQTSRIASLQRQPSYRTKPLDTIERYATRLPHGYKDVLAARPVDGRIEICQRRLNTSY